MRPSCKTRRKIGWAASDDDQPRCCKRASRIAVEAAVEYLRDHLAIDLPPAERVRCAYSAAQRTVCA